MMVTNCGFVEESETHPQPHTNEDVVTVVGRNLSAPQEESGKGAKKDKFNFTRRQWTFLVIYGLANVFRGVSILIGGPFYPPIAEDRGVTQTEYGFVFGSYDFSTFIVSMFFFGMFIIPRFGPRLVLKLSTLNLAICTTLFGCLQLTNDRTLFLTLSFVIRIIAGAGDAGFYPSAFVIFQQEFDGNVSMAIGLFELLFGIGAIGGPLIFGSFIDEIEKGFLVVYAITGFCLFVCVLLNHFCTPPPLPSSSFLENNETEDIEIPPGPPQSFSQLNSSTLGLAVEDEEKPKKWFHLFFIPTILVVFANLFATAASIGFITGTLEAHLEQFELKTIEMSAVFIVSNSIYTLLTPAWGKISDYLKGYHRNLVVFGGASLVFLGFSFIGPLPFLSNKSMLWSTLVGLVLHGMGIGAAVMSSFPHAVEAALLDGFPATEDTFSLISCLYVQTFTLGNAVGPSVSGLLVDNFQFQNATLFIFILALFVLIAISILTLIQTTRLTKKS